MALNKAMVIGHLGQKPELRYIPTSGRRLRASRSQPTTCFLTNRGRNRSASTGTIS